MQSTLWPILMTMLIWNDLMKSQHDNLSLGSLRLMTSDRQILYPQDVWGPFLLQGGEFERFGNH